MKKLYFLFVLFLTFFQGFSQNYQAVIRDANGIPLVNQKVYLRIDLTNNNTTYYTEGHDVNTNEFGLVNLVIGQGTSSDDFTAIDWSIRYDMEIYINGDIIDTAPLQPVPYARYADTGGVTGISAEQAAAIEANTAKVGISSEQAAAIISNSEVASINTTAIGTELTRALAAEADLQSQIDLNTAKVGVYTDGSDNTAAGVDALSTKTGQRNTAIGKDALRTNTDGGYNTAIGYYSLRMNKGGDKNAALGNYALQLNTEGDYNTAVGYKALQSNTTGRYNTASGSAALQKNTTGLNNTASGTSALFSNTDGSYNTASGTSALTTNTTGAGNTASGANALFSQTEGEENVAIGNRAMYSNTTGSYNVAIGSRASISSNSGTNQTVIGYNATGKGDNTVVLGNGNITDVYAADDGAAVIHAKGITFSDGTTQTTGSKVTFNQVMTTGFTDIDNVLEIGDLMIRVNNNYLEWKVGDFVVGGESGSFHATVTIKGSLSGVWNYMNSSPNVGDHGSISTNTLWQEIVKREGEDYKGHAIASELTNPGLWYHKMVEIELINTSVNESYKITAFGNGVGRGVTIKGEYWNFK